MGLSFLDIDGSDPVSLSKEAARALAAGLERADNLGIRDFLFLASSVDEFDARSEVKGLRESLGDNADVIISALRDEYLSRTAKDYSEKTRREYAEKGWALPDGSFPIKDCGDVKDAIHRAHQAKDPEAARRHIIKRWKELGCGGKEPFSSED